jgi:chemotaxis protein CheD
MKPPDSPRATAITVEGQVIVQIADLKVSRDPDVTLITYALGSCLGIMVHDPVRQIGGLLHVMLPLSTLAPDKARAKPGMFCDVAVPLLLRRMLDLGARKSDLVVKIVGGGVMNDARGVFNIGRRNCIAVQQQLRSLGVTVSAWDVGGRASRTVSLHVGSGRVLVRRRRRLVPL